MSETRARAHQHECAECGRRFSCSKAHTILDGGQFGLHARCATRLAFVFPESGPIRISLRPSRRRQVPPCVEPVAGNAAILARVLGRYGGPCTFDVLAWAYRREHGAHVIDEIARIRKGFKELAKDERDLVARLYGKELKRLGKGKWHAAAIAAMNRGKKLGLVPFNNPGTVRTHWCRLQAREKRNAV